MNEKVFETVKRMVNDKIWWRMGCSGHRFLASLLAEINRGIYDQIGLLNAL